MNKLNKKGLSTVITTLLLILLTIIAIVIVWAIFRGLLDQSDENLKNVSDCSKIIIDIQKVVCTSPITTPTPIDGSCTATITASGYAVNKAILSVSDSTSSFNTGTTPEVITIGVSNSIDISTGTSDFNGKSITVNVAPILDNGYSCIAYTKEVQEG